MHRYRDMPNIKDHFRKLAQSFYDRLPGVTNPFIKGNFAKHPSARFLNHTKPLTMALHSQEIGSVTVACSEGRGDVRLSVPCTLIECNPAGSAAYWHDTRDERAGWYQAPSRQRCSSSSPYFYVELGKTALHLQVTPHGVSRDGMKRCARPSSGIHLILFCLTGLGVEPVSAWD
uniref:Uncharacterized protein n=1 Tax=Timema cristinae TaxID=61476 RepID=A0A7R9CI25_TIMCR|nr:unnamed protein product [Timema cristinae]